MGRPKTEVEVIEAKAKAIRGSTAGLTIKECARLARLTESVLHEWLLADDEFAADFYEASTIVKTEVRELMRGMAADPDARTERKYLAEMSPVDSPMTNNDNFRKWLTRLEEAKREREAGGGAEGDV